MGSNALPRTKRAADDPNGRRGNGSALGPTPAKRDIVWCHAINGISQLGAKAATTVLAIAENLNAGASLQLQSPKDATVLQLLKLLSGQDTRSVVRPSIKQLLVDATSSPHDQHGSSQACVSSLSKYPGGRRFSIENGRPRGAPLRSPDICSWPKTSSPYAHLAKVHPPPVPAGVR